MVNDVGRSEMSRFRTVTLLVCLFHLLNKIRICVTAKFQPCSCIQVLAFPFDIFDILLLQP